MAIYADLVDVKWCVPWQSIAVVWFSKNQRGPLKLYLRAAHHAFNDASMSRPHARFDRRGGDKDACNSRCMTEEIALKALVYQGPGKKAVVERAKPVIAAPTDAIVRMVKTTICGTDLHILKGDVPTCDPGRILGHEGVGVVENVGPAVEAFHSGDHVIVSCITSCGKCDYCRRGMCSHCANGGWVLGNKIDGTQAEYVRIPFADTSLYHIPAGAEEDALVMLSDILPTGFECGVLNGKVQPGSTVAIVGAGPIGLAALLTAQFYSPAEIIMVDMVDNRLQMATHFGATDVYQQPGRQGRREDHENDRRARRRHRN